MEIQKLTPDINSLMEGSQFIWVPSKRTFIVVLSDSNYALMKAHSQLSNEVSNYLKFYMDHETTNMIFAPNDPELIETLKQS